jgi:hypothetical protein
VNIMKKSSVLKAESTRLSPISRVYDCDLLSCQFCLLNKQTEVADVTGWLEPDSLFYFIF